MRQAFAIVWAGLFLFGECLFACETQPVHFQAAAMLHRILKRTPMVLQGHVVRIKGTIELLVVVSNDGTPSCISVVRGHPILTSAAIASVKEWRFRPYRKNRKRVTYSGALVLDAREVATPD
jgi:Gram-negative bacterial TonB protein C-terminal